MNRQIERKIEGQIVSQIDIKRDSGTCNPTIKFLIILRQHLHSSLNLYNIKIEDRQMDRSQIDR